MFGLNFCWLNAMTGLKRTAADAALSPSPSSKKAKNDDFLPARLRYPNGLWHQGEPVLARIFTVNGDYVAEWSLPTTALAYSLCSRAACLYLTNPGRFSFIGTEGGQHVITYKSCKPLIWLFRFEKIISLQGR